MSSLTQKRNPHHENSDQPQPTERLDFITGLALDADLKAQDVRVALVLLSHWNRETGLLCPKHKTIASKMSCSESTVRRSIERLVQCGWFSTERRFREDGSETSSQYFPNWKRVIANDRGSSPVNNPVVHPRATRLVIDEQPGSSLVSNKLSEVNPVNEPSEKNTKRPMASTGVCVPSPSEHPAGHNDNWPADAWGRFWSEYPNQVYEMEAREEFARIDRQSFGFDELMAGLKNYKINRPKDQFWMNPSRFLQSGKWKHRPANGSQHAAIRSRMNVAI